HEAFETTARYGGWMMSRRIDTCEPGVNPSAVTHGRASWIASGALSSVTARATTAGASGFAASVLAPKYGHVNQPAFHNGPGDLPLLPQSAIGSAMARAAARSVVVVNRSANRSAISITRP